MTSSGVSLNTRLNLQRTDLLSIPLFSRKRAAHLRLGKQGEDAAERYLCDHGYEVIARDTRFPKGEIDFILRAGLSFVFAEVKTRRFKRLEDLQTVRMKDVIRHKQKRRIYRAAFTYMHKLGKPPIPYRFDLLEVLYLNNRLYEIRHIRSAFGQRSFQKKTNLFS